MTSYPATRAMPLVAGRNVVRMRMVVVLPAPLGPRNPTISFSVTWKLTWSTAWIGPKYLVRFSTWIMLHPVLQETCGVVAGQSDSPGGRPTAGPGQRNKRYAYRITGGEPGKFGGRKGTLLPPSHAASHPPWQRERPPVE